MTDTKFSSNTEKSPELSELTQNESLKQILNSKFVKFFSDDPASKIALVTAVITAGSFLVRVIDYIRWKGYLSVFFMDVSYIQFSAEKGFSEFLLEAVVFIGFTAATSITYLTVDRLDFLCNVSRLSCSTPGLKLYQKAWRVIKDIVASIRLIFSTFALNCLLNLLLWRFTASAKVIQYSGWLEYVIALLAFAVIEFVAAGILFLKKKREATVKRRRKRKNNDQAGDTMGSLLKVRHPIMVDIALSSVSIFLFMLCTSAYWLGTVEAKQKVHFSFVDDNYAVVYQDDDCYWTVYATEENGTLQLDATRQKVIEIQGVEIQYREYKEVEIDYE